MTTKTFNGFPKKFTKFFADLAMNNNKLWFNEHKPDYEQFVLGPSKLFVIAMGERLSELSPDINAIPMVNKSLFRLNRDTRFSKDKSPYKTNVGIFFWEVCSFSPANPKSPGQIKRKNTPGDADHP